MVHGRDQKCDRLPYAWIGGMRQDSALYLTGCQGCSGCPGAGGCIAASARMIGRGGDDMAEREIAPGHDACGGLFGCSGGDDRRYMVEAEAVDAALTPRSRSWR